MENILASKEIQVERKHVVIEVRENERGRFLRITETAHGRRNTVIIPSTGLSDFTAAINEVLAGSAASAAAGQKHFVNRHAFSETSLIQTSSNNHSHA